MYTITLKEPVRVQNEKDMKSILQFENVKVNSAFAVGLVECWNKDQPSYFPIANMLGIINEETKEPKSY